MAKEPSTSELSEDLADSSGGLETLDAGPSTVSKLVAEAIGTFVLVVVGLGAALLAVPDNGGMTFMVGLGFALAALVMIVAVGHISGAHLNPAVTIGLWAAGRFPGRDIALYVLAQTVGAIAAGGVLTLVAGALSSDAKAAMDSVSIGWGEHSPQGVGLVVALLAEVFITAGLVATILAATSSRAPKGQAQFTIAAALFMAVLIAIPFTNGALNPARATGTAVFANTWALTQLWAWWVAPIVGGFLTGLLYRVFGAQEDVSEPLAGSR